MHSSYPYSLSPVPVYVCVRHLDLYNMRMSVILPLHQHEQPFRYHVSVRLACFAQQLAPPHPGHQILSASYGPAITPPSTVKGESDTHTHAASSWCACMHALVCAMLETRRLYGCLAANLFTYRHNTLRPLPSTSSPTFSKCWARSDRYFASVIVSSRGLPLRQRGSQVARRPPTYILEPGATGEATPYLANKSETWVSYVSVYTYTCMDVHMCVYTWVFVLVDSALYTSNRHGHHTFMRPIRLVWYSRV
ncbi:hypothetical protein GGS23DRAFT_403833 [Durotheca rogersii]|uniref:uncharacterized protein n=1 Tax=Durotheca rogersii TaxID=419775 RepID=UPI00221E87A9|nr:uncharacterized protein GGS23DRAFT_403833 [Durotheca rogersii]KAI5865003.1 hypothetical protein GGS23DRAFT_403833 [Durotheca rogersii]